MTDETITVLTEKQMTHMLECLTMMYRNSLDKKEQGRILSLVERIAGSDFILELKHD